MPQASDILEVGLRQGFTRQQVQQALASLDDLETERLAWMCRWVDARHEFQVVPEGQWSNWVILAGRGSGKTRVGAEWSGMSAASAVPGPKPDRTLVVAPTKSDLRDVCFEGDSGLMSVIPSSLIKYYHKSPAPQIMLMNGSIIGGIAAEAFQRTRGPQWHRCLVGSTMVLMADGAECRLDCVRAGDYVMTRSGARLVEWSGMTGAAAEVSEVRTECGSTIRGTMEHPVWTQEEGFVCLSNLTQLHHVMCLPTVSDGSGAQMAITTDATVSDRAQKDARSPSIYTSRFTRTRSAPFRWGSLSTTATRIKAITSQLISKLCRGLTIIGFTARAEPTATGSDQQPGAYVMQDGRKLCTLDASASSAAPSLNLDHKVVRAPLVDSSAWNVGAIATLSAVSNVRKLPGRHAVYNLQVQGQPEFFANGILVHNCWADEVAAWGEGGKADPEEVWDTMVMSIRLGNDTRILVTTTPKNRPLIKRLVSDPDTVMTSASTHVNADNLSPEFSRRILKYDGTKVGRQEIYAELIDSEEGGIISRSWLKHWPADKPLPEFHFIVMSLDTGLSEEDHDKKKQTSDPSACSVWGCFKLPSGKPGIILLDCWAERLGFPDLVDRVKRESDPMQIRYGSNLSQKPIILPGNIPKAYRKQMAPKIGGRAIDVIVIEGKANGKSLRQQLAKSEINTVQFNPTKDKLERGHFVSPIAKDGLIWIPDSPNPDKYGKPKFMSWAEPLVEQLCSYSGEGSVVHDDLYDTTTQAWNLIDWYWLHHLEQRKGAKERAGTIAEDRQIDRRTSNPNPYMA